MSDTDNQIILTVENPVMISGHFTGCSSDDSSQNHRHLQSYILYGDDGSGVDTSLI